MSLLRILLSDNYGAYYGGSDFVIMLIYEMDERLRIGDLSHNFSASNGFNVKSWSYPELNYHAVYIPGVNKSLDNVPTVFHAFDPEIKGKEVIEKALDALKEYIGHKLSVDVYYEPLGNDIYDFREFSGRTLNFTLE